MKPYTECFRLLEVTERKMLKAASCRPVRDMGKESSRREVRDLFRHSLGIHRIPEPELQVDRRECRKLDGCSVELLSGRSWEHCPVAAHLFYPATPPPWPVVTVCCGHAWRKTDYCRMGMLLARTGIAALVPDNIGQNERSAMGHWDVLAPFALGISFQGMIVAETSAWIRFLRKDCRFSGIGAAGNSGGGLLSLCLAALEENLAAVASTGYPSTFEYIARKRKNHCACNWIPGALGRFEMWEIYSLFAPRPLLLMQGEQDEFFPAEIFSAMTKQVREVYSRFSAEERFFSCLTKGGHAWSPESRFRIASFFSEVFQTRKPEREDESAVSRTDEFGQCLPVWPEDARHTDDLVWSLFRKTPYKPLELHEIFPAGLSPDPGSSDPADAESGRKTFRETMRILAQWECFLKAPGEH